MRQFLFFCAATSLLLGCALRPRYADFVSSKTQGQVVTLVLTSAATGKPIPNARVEVSELRNRIVVTTAADGTFTLPVDRKYLDENPVVVVSLPGGLQKYKLNLAPEAPELPEPVVEADAGVKADTGI